MPADWLLFWTSTEERKSPKFSWPTLRSALTIGYLGGLTTYSSFNYESTRLAQEGTPDLAAMNAAMTWVGCFVAGWLGMLTARHVLGAGG